MRGGTKKVSTAYKIFIYFGLQKNLKTYLKQSHVEYIATWFLLSMVPNSTSAEIKILIPPICTISQQTNTSKYISEDLG